MMLTLASRHPDRSGVTIHELPSTIIAVHHPVSNQENLPCRATYCWRIAHLPPSRW